MSPGERTPDPVAIRVVIADDHPGVRAGLQQLLGGVEGFVVVAAARNGAEAVAAVERRRPDVVVMDLSMPGMDGVETTRRIVAIAPGVPVLVLTSVFDRRRIADAVEAGAVGYLLKDAEPEQLVRAIRAAGRSTRDRGQGRPSPQY
jgi:DNA-binding NarL/FixJ family response regulator